MGIDLFEPSRGTSEQTLAQLFEEFSEFVLNEERDKCLQILQDDIDTDGGGLGASVGELQGGNEAFSIYRVSFPDGDDDEENGDGCDYEVDIHVDGYGDDGRYRYSSNAAIRLLKEFNRYNGNRNMLTMRKIKQYMLGMCDRRTAREREEYYNESYMYSNDSEIDIDIDADIENDIDMRIDSARKYTSLGNLMFIMQFGGPTEGQVRHIDNMVPNVQICLYMSPSCPSTIVYAMDDGDGDSVTNGALLVKYWERNGHVQGHDGNDGNDGNDDDHVHTVPEFIKDILCSKGNRKLKSKWYTKYFAFWNTIDSHLACFGKLYQPVSFQLGLQTDPGTTLLAGGNEVHAGPPTTGPRMFAFAIGIPEERAAGVGDDHEEDGGLDEGNDGEVQYSPVLLQIDFCCLLFSMLDHEYLTKTNANFVREAKLYLLEILLYLIRDYPMKGYLRQIDDERIGIRNWLENVLDSIDDKRALELLVIEAADGDEIFFSPDVIKRRSKKKKKRKVKAR